MDFTIKNNFKGFIKGVNKLQQDIAFVQMTATNNLAFDVQDKVKKEISGKLKINNKRLPTLRVTKASKKSLFALVFHDGWQEDALNHHFKGGDRERKGMEKAMQYFDFMGKDEILTPSPGTKINGGVYTQMISQLKINYKAGYTANESKRSRVRKKKPSSVARFFLIKKSIQSHLSPGIYARMPGHNRPICMLRIAKKPSYKKKMDLDLTASKVIERRYENHYKKAIDKALEIRLKNFKR